MTSRKLKKEIEIWKKKRKAIILVHNYQPTEIQEIADYLGDSLGLSQQAARTKAEVIVFCGVHFMAETASILSPEKVVLMPDLRAGCPMADMINAQQLKDLKEKHPGVPVVCYVNSSAEVKALSDFSCTSANAVKIAKSISSDKIIFVPDQYLGDYTARQTEKNFILWPGYCPTHLKILPEHIIQAKKEHPAAKVVVHPECRAEVIALADEVLSTSGMCRYAQKPEVKEVIVGTEIGLLARLKRENPEKKFYPASPLAICPNMKLNSLEKVLFSLQEMKEEVRVPAEIRERAKRSIERMVAQ
jgi:quinolinate synthase